MIWDLDTIREVRCARAAVDVAAELVTLPPEREVEVEGLLREVYRQLADELAALVEPLLAVDIRPQDVAMAEAGRGDDRAQVHFLAWWEPATDDVELVGGANDGHHIRWNRAPDDPVRIPVLGPVVMEKDPVGPPSGPPPPLPRPDTYGMTGWNDSGWWIYGLEKK